MRIFTKKAFELKDGNGGSVTTAPLAFHTIPDSCASDQMFKWAVADGSIEVIADKVQEKKVMCPKNDPRFGN